MFPLVSQTNNYFSLLLEKKKSYVPKTICPEIINEVDLASTVRDIGYIIPIETLTFVAIAKAPLIEFPGKDEYVASVLSGKYELQLNIYPPTLSKSDEFTTLKANITDKQFFPSRLDESPSTIPIFLYDDEDIKLERTTLINFIPSSMHGLVSIKKFPSHRLSSLPFHYLDPFTNTKLPLLVHIESPGSSATDFVNHQLTNAFKTIRSDATFHKLYPQYIDYILDSDNTKYKVNALSFQHLALAWAVVSPLAAGTGQSIDQTLPLIKSRTVTYPEIQQCFDAGYTISSPPHTYSNEYCAASKTRAMAFPPSSIIHVNPSIPFAVTLSDLSKSMGWLRAFDVKTEFSPSLQHNLTLHIDLTSITGSEKDPEGILSSSKTNALKREKSILSNSCGMTTTSSVQALLTPDSTKISHMLCFPTKPHGGRVWTSTTEEFVSKNCHQQNNKRESISILRNYLLPSPKKRRFTYIIPSEVAQPLSPTQKHIDIATNMKMPLCSWVNIICKTAQEHKHPPRQHYFNLNETTNLHAVGNFSLSSSGEPQPVSIAMVTSLSQILWSAQHTNLPLTFPMSFTVQPHNVKSIPSDLATHTLSSLDSYYRFSHLTFLHRDSSDCSRSHHCVTTAVDSLVSTETAKNSTPFSVAEGIEGSVSASVNALTCSHKYNDSTNTDNEDSAAIIKGFAGQHEQYKPVNSIVSAHAKANTLASAGDDIIAAADGASTSKQSILNNNSYSNNAASGPFSIDLESSDSSSADDESEYFNSTNKQYVNEASELHSNLNTTVLFQENNGGESVESTSSTHLTIPDTVDLKICSSAKTATSSSLVPSLPSLSASRICKTRTRQQASTIPKPLSNVSSTIFLDQSGAHNEDNDINSVQSLIDSYFLLNNCRSRGESKSERSGSFTSNTTPGFNDISELSTDIINNDNTRGERTIEWDEMFRGTRDPSSTSVAPLLPSTRDATSPDFVPNTSNISNAEAAALKRDETGVSRLLENRSNDLRLSGLVIVMSEELFVHQPLCAAVLSQRYRIQAVGRGLEYPLDCVVDEVTGVSVIPEHFLQQSDEVKRYIKQLTKLAFKFNTIWVLILKYTEKTSTPLDSSADGTISALKNTAIGTAVDRNATFLNASYGSFYQALSQFTSVHCLVQTRMIAQEAALPTQLYIICQEAADTATLQNNMLLATFKYRPFLAENVDTDEAVLAAHCEFLQLFPTLNYYVAAELLFLFPLKQLAHIPPIPSLLKDLAEWEEGERGMAKEGGAMTATLRRCEAMLTGFYTLLNKNFHFRPLHNNQGNTSNR